MIPQRIMMEILLTGKPITAQRAYEIGLVNRLADPDRLMEAALELAGEILDGAPLSVRAARETVMLATEMGRSAALKAARHASSIATTVRMPRKAQARSPGSVPSVEGR